MSIIIFMMLGILSIILFYMGVYFPIAVSIGFVGVVALYVFFQLKAKRIGIMIVILLSLYFLPFVHIFPYLWFDFNSNPGWLWGLKVRPYMVDRPVIELTAMIGAVSAFGAALGISFAQGKITKDTGLNLNGSQRVMRSIATPIWLLWVLIGIFFSWISAPPKTILETSYGSVHGAHEAFNVSSAWLISYIILSFAFIDALLDKNSMRKAIKWPLIIVTFSFVLVYLQLFRGDRAALPWVFSMVVVYYYLGVAPNQRTKSVKLPWIKLGLVSAALIFLGAITQAVRHNLTGEDLASAFSLIIRLFTSGDIALSNLLHGTWSAVLLTPLSVAGDYHYKLHDTKWGKDYLDLIFSLPPGFLADAIGYERPISSTQGPAWEMRYGMGGTHAVVLPFRNFLIVGVFFIQVLLFYLLSRSEKAVLRRFSTINVAFFAILIGSSAHWFWYGEKNGINAIILWVIFAFFYRVSLGMSHKKRYSSNRAPC